MVQTRRSRLTSKPKRAAERTEEITAGGDDRAVLVGGSSQCGNESCEVSWTK
jgi:hypothetical protein